MLNRIISRNATAYEKSRGASMRIALFHLILGLALLLGGFFDRRGLAWRGEAPGSVASSTAPRPLGASAAARTGSGQVVQSDPRVPGLQWARMPAGTFQMGCVPGDGECSDLEEPRHAVTLTQAFDVMTTEVTLGMFRTYALATGRTVPDQPDWNTSEAQPVVNVTWDEALAFCAWAGGRLPTEAEWEYAARGGTDGWTYAWGNSPRPEVNGKRAANVRDQAMKRMGKYGTDSLFEGYDDGFPETAPVASFAPNAYGLYDMPGNASEWVADWFAAYSSGPVTDPRGLPAGLRRVVRGGSWYSGLRSLRVSVRHFKSPGLRDYLDGGLRCARDVFGVDRQEDRPKQKRTSGNTSDIPAVEPMYTGQHLADLPLSQASVDPCCSCTDR